MTYAPYTKTKPPQIIGQVKAKEILESFYLNSIDAPSSFSTLVYALALGGSQRSAEANQFSPEEKELDTIHLHRLTRSTLIKLPFSTQLILAHYHDENQRYLPQIVHALGPLRYLSPILSLTPSQLNAFTNKPEYLKELKEQLQAFLTSALNEFVAQWNSHG